MREGFSIGLVGRDTPKGLGTLTDEYCRFLPVSRVLAVRSDLDRDRAGDRGWPATTYVDDANEGAEEWLRDIDVLVVLEFAAQGLFREARRRGIPSVLKVNIEFLPESLDHPPDLFLCSSGRNYDAVTEGRKILLADPVDTDLFRFRERAVARVFVHNAGTLGLLGANCTEEVLQAIPLVKSRDARFIVRSQVPLPMRVDDPRVRYEGALEDRRDLYREGDVLLLPQKFRATSLPMHEAMASGMPVLTTDYAPFNEFCEFLVEPDRTESFRYERFRRRLTSWRIRPEVLAARIDDLVGADIADASRRARAYAESIGWDVVLPRLHGLLREEMESARAGRGG